MHLMLDLEAKPVKSCEVVYDGSSFVVVVQALSACRVMSSVASVSMMVAACVVARTSRPR